MAVVSERPGRRTSMWRQLAPVARTGRRHVGIIGLTKAADAADVFHALRIAGEAAIAVVIRSAVIGTPRIVLRMSRRRDRAEKKRSGKQSEKQSDKRKAHSKLPCSR